MTISPVGAAPLEASYDPLQEWGAVAAAALTIFVGLGTIYLAGCKKQRIYSISPPPSPPLEMIDIPEPDVLPSCFTEENRKKVEELCNTMAQGLWAITWNSLRLNQLGAEIDHIHPFSFLLASPKEGMRAIFQTGALFIQNKMVDGIIKGLERDPLEPYIDSFAKKMGADADRIRTLIDCKHWTRLISELFEVPVPHRD